MPVFNIHHITKYEYDRPVKESVNEIRIFPIVDKDQETITHQINITDDPELLNVTDYWGNKLGMFNLITAHQELIIESKLTVRTLSPVEPVINQLATLDDLKASTSGNLQMLELAQISDFELREQLKEVTNEFYQPGMTIGAIVSQCAGFIFNHFQYIKGITTIYTTVSEVLKLRSGVCQDFAHVMVDLLRFFGIPSRYVSGYICPNKNGMRGEGATHAWVEAWVPESGWAGIDPTNNVWVSNHHVKLAVGRNFNDCSPIKGTFKGPAKQFLSIYVSVGYEDGQSFEELNNVRLDTVAVDEESAEYLATFQGQQ